MATPTVDNIADGMMADAASMAEDPAARCILIGPSGAGKSYLLLAMNRACSQPSPDDFSLSFQPADEKAEKLLREAGDFAFGRGRLEANLETVTYRFRIELVRYSLYSRLVQRLPLHFTRYLPRTRPLVESAFLHIVDGPGGDLLPHYDDLLSPVASTDSETTLLNWARNAHSLMLCVNAADPKFKTLVRELPPLLGRIRAEQRHVHFDRVLLLLTQADKVVSSYLQVVKEFGKHGPVKLAPALQYLCQTATPAELCQIIDPLAFACDTLGKEIVHALWQSVSPRSKFGIGLCSAWGFDADTGAAFVEDTEGFGGHRLVDEQSWLHWTPFGVREALYFILNSDPPQDRKIGPIVEFVKDDRLSLPFARPTNIPLQEPV